MLLDEIGVYLEGQAIGARGTNLFLGFLPDAPDAAVALLEYSGLEGLYIHEIAGPAYERPRVQVVARAATYTAARTKAEDAHKALGRVSNTPLSGVWYVSIDALQSPFLVERDANQRVVIGFNVQVIKARS